MGFGMVDIVDAVTRSRMMAGIKGKHTKPEIIVRRYLHKMGCRFRLHRKDLPGQPDIVLPAHRLVIFVHGCFWHRHANCYYSTSPATRSDFWYEKFSKNIDRDERHKILLEISGWRVLTVWECGLKHCPNEFCHILDFVCSDVKNMEWPATPPRGKSQI